MLFYSFCLVASIVVTLAALGLIRDAAYQPYRVGSIYDRLRRKSKRLADVALGAYRLVLLVFLISSATGVTYFLARLFKEALGG